jgi:hypothetical protein
MVCLVSEEREEACKRFLDQKGYYGFISFDGFNLSKLFYNNTFCKCGHLRGSHSGKNIIIQTIISIWWFFDPLRFSIGCQFCSGCTKFRDSK